MGSPANTVVATKEAMTFERAVQITGAICDCGLIAMGLDRPDNAIDLTTISLQEMLEATGIVRDHPGEPSDGGRTLYVYPDDRMVAAVYTLVNYSDSRSPIAEYGRKMIGVVPIRPAEGGAE